MHGSAKRNIAFGPRGVYYGDIMITWNNLSGFTILADSKKVLMCSQPGEDIVIHVNSPDQAQDIVRVLKAFKDNVESIQANIAQAKNSQRSLIDSDDWT